MKRRKQLEFQAALQANKERAKQVAEAKRLRAEALKGAKAEDIGPKVNTPRNMYASISCFPSPSPSVFTYSVHTVQIPLHVGQEGKV